MLLLDTNVLSALMSDQPPAAVLGLRARFPAERYVTAAVCEAEVLAGIAALPSGVRKQRLALAAHELFRVKLAGGVLPFDEPAAERYAEVFVRRQRAGRPGQPLDLMIAAIAGVHGAAVVTRNARDFAETDIDVIDPWN